AVAGPRRPDGPPLARTGRAVVLRDLLLRLRHSLLPGPGAVRSRRPHADAAGAGPVRVLAHLGARAPASAPDRHRRRPRTPPPAWPLAADGMHRQALRARRRDRDPAAASLRRERVAQPARAS